MCGVCGGGEASAKVSRRLRKGCLAEGVRTHGAGTQDGACAGAAPRSAVFYSETWRRAPTQPRRAASGRERRAARAAAVAEATCLLLDLSHDEVSIVFVTHELCDPLRPLLAVHLSSTANKGLWVPMQERPPRGVCKYAAATRA